MYMSRSNSHDFSGTSSKNPYDWLAPSWVSCVVAWGEMGGAPIASRLLMFFVQENVRMRYVKINRKGKTFRHWVADSVEIGFAVWCLRSWTMMLFDFFCVCGHITASSHQKMAGAHSAPFLIARFPSSSPSPSPLSSSSSPSLVLPSAPPPRPAARGPPKVTSGIGRTEPGRRSGKSNEGKNLESIPPRTQLHEPPAT